MAAAHIVLVGILMLSISPSATGVQCPVCSNIPGMGGNRCDAVFIERRTCPLGLDRCMAVTGETTLGDGKRFELQNCSNSLLCDQGSDYNMCQILNMTGFVQSCKMVCSPPSFAPTLSTKAQTPKVSDVRCPVCSTVPGMEGSRCDDGHVGTKTCPFGLDKCMTVSVVGFGMNFELKNCSNSLLCDPGSDYNICQILNSTGIATSCNMTCSPPSVVPTLSTTAPAPTVTGVQCPVCSNIPGLEGSRCDAVYIESRTCPSGLDRCMAVTGEMIVGDGKRFELQNCSNSFLCDQGSDNNMCQILNMTGFVKSCNMKCSPPSFAPTLSTKAQTPEASGVQCPVCSTVPGMEGSRCDGSHVETKTCPFGLDKCMTVSVAGFGMNFELKNCSNSLLCDPGSDYNICQILNFTGIATSCNMTCSPPSVVPTLSTTAQAPKVTGVQCPVCSNIPLLEGSRCDAVYIESRTCPSGLDRCMAVTGEMIVGDGERFELQNCSNSLLCDQGSDNNMCQILNMTGFVKSCNVKCSPPSFAPTLSTKAQTPKASGVRCPVCSTVPGMEGSRCDDGHVETKTCPFGLDKCMTVYAASYGMKFEFKNCSNSLLCDPGSDYNMCTILDKTGVFKSCSVTCVTPTVAPTPSTTSHLVRKAGAFKLNQSPVCVENKGDRFGKFYVPSSGKLAAIRLVHLYGYVTCHPRFYGRWSYWGCAGSKVNILVTNSANRVILPADQFVFGSTKWSKIPGYNSLSPEIVLSVSSDPLGVTTGEELRLWFGEDLANENENDNEGKVCADVFALFV